MSSRRSVRMSSRRRLWSQAKVRSTTQRWRPSPEPCSVWRRAIIGLIAALPDEAAVLVVVVAAVGDQRLSGRRRGPADAAADGRHPVEQREQLGDVVAVAAGERPGQRHAAAVYEQVLLAAATASVDGARTGLASPLFRLHVTGVGDRPRPLDLARRRATRRAAARAAAPTRPPAARPAAAATPSSRSRSRAPAADAPSRSRCAARTRSPATPAGHRTACDPDNGTAAACVGNSGSIRSHNPSGTSHGFARIDIPPER